MDIIALFCDIDYFLFLLRTESFNCQFFMIFAVASRAQLDPTSEDRERQETPQQKHSLLQRYCHPKIASTARSYCGETLGRKSQLPEFRGLELTSFFWLKKDVTVIPIA